MSNYTDRSVFLAKVLLGMISDDLLIIRFGNLTGMESLNVKSGVTPSHHYGAKFFSNGTC